MEAGGEISPEKEPLIFSWEVLAHPECRKRAGLWLQFFKQQGHPLYQLPSSPSTSVKRSPSLTTYNEKTLLQKGIFITFNSKTPLPSNQWERYLMDRPFDSYISGSFPALYEKLYAPAIYALRMANHERKNLRSNISFAFLMPFILLGGGALFILSLHPLTALILGSIALGCLLVALASYASRCYIINYEEPPLPRTPPIAPLSTPAMSLTPQ